MLALFVAFFAALFLRAQPTQTQTIPLSVGWNLISLQVGNAPMPIADFAAAIEQSNRLLEVWGYVPSGNPARPGVWLTSQFGPGMEVFPDDLFEIVPGHGYWVKVSQATRLIVTGTPWSGNINLVEGWNLIGLPVPGLARDETQDFASVFGASAARIPQVWSFDAPSSQWLGQDSTAVPAVRSLAGVAPGKGYWVYALEPISLTVAPYVALPQDADDSPLQLEEDFSAVDARWLGSNPVAYVGQKVRFRGTNDVAFDLNNNGLLDSPFTQDTLVFNAGVDVQVISIGNTGSGIFPWSIAKEGTIPWLKFDDGTLPAGTAFAAYTDSASGVVSADRDSIVLRVDRTGLLPGRHVGAVVTVRAGALTRSIKLVLVVPTTGGDWKGYASVRRVNGKAIELGKVDLAMSVFMKSPIKAEDLVPDAARLDRFDAVLNRDRSLLFPKDVFMNGVFYAGNQFSLTTSFVMPEGDRNSPPFDEFQDDPANPKGDRDTNGDGILDVSNPFPQAISREVTLLGERKSPNLLEGSYVEAIGGALPNGQLIFMEGDFVLTRETAEATKRSVFNSGDTATVRIGGSTGPGFVERVIHVADPVSIQAVTVGLSTSPFSAPAKLVITLTSPKGTIATLHRNGATLPQEATYHPNDFISENGAGDWKLRIQWNPASTPERGNLLGWTLNLAGLASYGATGRIVDTGGVPIEDAQLILSGSNIIAQTTSAAVTGAFAFTSLTENNYTLAVSRPGYVSATQKFTLSDASVVLPDIVLTPLVSGDATLQAMPAFGAAPFHSAFYLAVPKTMLDASVGANATALWSFGDGTAPVSSAAAPDDDFTTTSAKHVYVTPGVFQAQVTLSGDLGFLTRTVSIHAQRVAPDAAGPAHQISNISFVGSVAAPSSAGLSNPLPTADESTVTVLMTGGVSIPGVKSAVVWQESKRDTAAFDLDRFPLRTGAAPFAPLAEDTDFRSEVYQYLEYPSGGGTPTLRTMAAPTDYAAGNSVFDPYVPELLAGQPIIERWRLEVILGGAVFGTQESAVGNFRLQVGCTQP